MQRGYQKLLSIFLAFAILFGLIGPEKMFYAKAADPASAKTITISTEERKTADAKKPAKEQAPIKDESSLKDEENKNEGKTEDKKKESPAKALDGSVKPNEDPAAPPFSK